METPQTKIQGLNLNSMARSVEIDYGSALEYLIALRNLQTSGFSAEDDKLRHLISTDLLKPSCENEYSRPLLPPMLKNGDPIDLLKLYSVVRDKGNYESVSVNGLWGLVAKELGFGSCVGSALKLIYSKYFAKLGLWEKKISNEKDLRDAIEDSALMDIDKDFPEIVSNVSCKKKEDGKYPSPKIDQSALDTSNVGSSCDSSSDLVDEGFRKKRKRESYEEILRWIVKVATDPCDPELESLPEISKWKSYDEEQLWKKVLKLRERMISERNALSVAEQLPENFWKRPMHPSMYEDSRRIRTSRRVIPAKVPSSKTQAPSESSSSDTRSDSDDEFGIKNESFSTDSVFFFLSDAENRKHVPVGPYFQAHVSEFSGELKQVQDVRPLGIPNSERISKTIGTTLPEWTKETYVSDSKWLGTRVWPLESGEKKRHLIERERMGKGRQDSCGCQYQGSIECVRFHIFEKRTRVKIELGSAFFCWKFDKMGEEVALSWTEKEEEKFCGVIRSNPSSLEKYFWDEIIKAFPSKKREELVSYYFNVYLLHRRIYQNRSTPSNIDSDDEESEFGSLSVSFRHETGKSPSSIFYSPKKAQS